MPKPSDLDETASRADDAKTPGERARGNEGGRVSDGKFEDVPQGGKRRGPGHWVNPKD